MTVEQTLARVEEDLRAGDVDLALTRLRSLVRSLPHRVDARSRLADVLRLRGDLVEAGRWSYLEEQRDPAEMAAFEHAFGDDPVRIMRALRWQGPEDAAGTEVARQRLREVRALAEATAGKSVDWTSARREAEASRWDALALVGWRLAGVVLVALVVIGAVTVVGWF